jgi:tetratricopeptide (TPR) repeat protein
MVFRFKDARWLASSWIVAVLLLLSTAPALAITARVTGVVTDLDGNPIPKVPVFFETVEVEGRAQASVVGKIKTNKKGKYTYPFLDIGRWKIYPELEGYLVLTMDIESIDSQGELRMAESEMKISRDQGNIPGIPVAPQGQGAVSRGKCEVNFVMVPEGEYSDAMARLQKGDVPAAKPAAPAQPVVSKKQDPVERGDEYLAGEDFAQAAAAYQAGVDEDPARADAYYGLGKALLKQDDIGGAQNALMKAAQLDPEMPGVNFHLATIYHDLAQDPAAIAALEKERVNTPDDETVLVNLGSLYRDAEDLEKAREVLEEVRMLNPENTDAALALADVHNALGDSSKAEAIYRTILDSNPGQEDIIWYNIGVNAYNAGKRPEAAQAFEKSIAANKKNSDSHRMLGYTLVGMGEFDKAIPHFEAYLKLNKKGPYAEEVTAFLVQLQKG